jgi:hypothetical protein
MRGIGSLIGRSDENYHSNHINPHNNLPPMAITDAQATFQAPGHDEAGEADGEESDTKTRKSSDNQRRRSGGFLYDTEGETDTIIGRGYELHGNVQNVK